MNTYHSKHIISLSVLSVDNTSISNPITIRQSSLLPTVMIVEAVSQGQLLFVALYIIVTRQQFYSGINNNNNYKIIIVRQIIDILLSAAVVCRCIGTHNHKYNCNHTYNSCYTDRHLESSPRVSDEFSEDSIIVCIVIWTG